MPDQVANRLRQSSGMSLQQALIGGLLLVILLSTVLVGLLGAMGISMEVRREAQGRVNSDLRTLWTWYREDSRHMLERVEQVAKALRPESRSPAELLAAERVALDLTVLNLCDLEGAPLAGTYVDAGMTIPIADDPVLRRAAAGESNWGTVQLPWERLARETGQAQAEQLQIELRQPTAEQAMAPALFDWLAVPVTNAEGKVVALLYGGRALNRNGDYVAELRDLVFGASDQRGQQVGTVTIFADGVRVATNVLDPEGQRALGTMVSEAVHRQVLEQGEIWSDRAWVVDAWYVSAYRPLRDPDGDIVGMLYTGLLDAPYVALRNTLLTRFALILIGSAVLAVLIATLVVRRITNPLKALTETAQAFQGDDWSPPSPPRLQRSFSEINTLQGALAQAQAAILCRDRRLSRRNETLRRTNDELERVNSNYMQTLRFVTHELKSPLAAMQSMINLMLDGYLGDVPEKIGSYLRRVNHNCEDLQDMVKNYLDLSRVERGELSIALEEADCRQDIVDPCVEQLHSLFRSRHMTLTVDCPEDIDMITDAGLIRIALSNYLSNAAKYGRDGGEVRLTVTAAPERVALQVWNEGAGFTEEEMGRLFQQFSRLKNENTRSKKGSGVGLFLCKHIAEMHGGDVRAASEPGSWASFELTLPRRAEPRPAASISAAADEP
ncbi:MAG: cache domain-containing protein [Phycisphaerales bacterium JB038]